MLENFAVSPNSVIVLPLPPPPPTEVGGTHQAEKHPLGLQMTVSQGCNLSQEWTGATTLEKETDDDLKGCTLIRSFVWFKAFN